MKNRIFLDYASITPIDKDVLREMEKTNKFFANPSALYNEAIEAKNLMLEARQKIAGFLNAQKNEIIFTSGGTESDNLALLGIFRKYKTPNFFPHFIVTDIEHPAILEVCNEIAMCGGDVTYIKVSADGIVSPKDIADNIQENTVLVSVMYANNEIGTVQPIKEIGRVIKNYREKHKTQFPYFHTDACQAGLFLPIDVESLGVDMMTLDGIKMYGPRGIGVLYKRGTVEIHPIMFGGGQEKGLRSGTENLPAIVGFAKAMEIARKIKEKESARIIELRDYAISEILKNFPNASLNGSQENRLPNNINICFPGLDAEFAVISLDVAGIAVSYSSSCRTLSESSTSYVINALGKHNCSASSLRITLGRGTTKKEIDQFIIKLKGIV